MQELVLGFAGPVPTPVQCMWQEVAWGAQSQLQRLDRPRRAKPEDSQPKGFLKVLKERWADLGPATQEALQAAGFKPKPPPLAEDSLLTLPADIQAMLELEAEKPSATPYEEGQHSSNALTKASHKYRQLARKKMDLQASITQAKEHLKALVEEDAQSKLSEALEQGNSVSVAHPSLGDIAAFEGIGKSLSIEFSRSSCQSLERRRQSRCRPAWGFPGLLSSLGLSSQGRQIHQRALAPRSRHPRTRREGQMLT